MQRTSLDALARELLSKARTVAGGHAAKTVCGGHEKVLRQTVIAMAADSKLAEHESPGEATVLVLQGRVRLWTEAASWQVRRGDLIVVPDTRHGLEATEDAVVLLTVAKLTHTANDLGRAIQQRIPRNTAVRPTPTATTRVLAPLDTIDDIVEEWGKQSFPASDPPSNW